MMIRSFNRDEKMSSLDMLFISPAADPNLIMACPFLEMNGKNFEFHFGVFFFKTYLDFDVNKYFPGILRL